MALTDRVVRLAKAEGRTLTLVDGQGLYLRVRPAGTKTWYVRHQGARRDSWRMLGRYPAMSLLQARIAAAKAHRPSSVRRTVGGVFELYRAVLRDRYASASEIERRFDRDVLPVLGDLELHVVRREDCARVIDGVTERGSKVMANRLLPDLQRFFRWCVEKGWLEENPAADMTRMVAGGRERPKERALTTSELRLLCGHLLAPRLNERTRIALALILLTGQRPGEVQGIDRSELVSPTWWHIPAARTKPRRLQKVYLAPQPRALLRFAFRRYGDAPFVTLDRCALSHATRRMRFTPPFTPHDLRRTMATHLSQLGVAPHVIEKMLNHKLGKLFEIYNRDEYLPERRAAWRLWGRTIAALRRNHVQDGTGASSGGLRGRRADQVRGAERPGSLQHALQRAGADSPGLLPEGG